MKTITGPLLAAALLVCFLCVPARAASQETYPVVGPEIIPSLIESIRITQPVDFCGERVPLENQDVRERMEREMLLMVWDRAQVVMWLKRSGRYFPFIEAMLKKNGMPDDLKYVAIIESSLMPHVGSSKGAMGYWQFIRDTGDKYGLTIDSGIDERRNIYASTRAAMDYLKKLHDMFGSWTLACAAYNMGEYGLRDHIKEQETTDYYNLYLPLETQRYVIRAVAAKIIMSNPARFGFRMTRDDYWKPLEFDRVDVSLPGRIHILTLAKAAGTFVKTIKDLNPEIRGFTLDAGKYSLLLPKGSQPGFEDRLAKALAEAPACPAPGTKGGVYTVKPGDTMSGIAERFNVPLSQLQDWNKGRAHRDIQPGDKLNVGGR